MEADPHKRQHVPISVMEQNVIICLLWSFISDHWEASLHCRAAVVSRLYFTTVGDVCNQNTSDWYQMKLAGQKATWCSLHWWTYNHQRLLYLAIWAQNRSVICSRLHWAKKQEGNVHEINSIVRVIWSNVIFSRQLSSNLDPYRFFHSDWDWLNHCQQAFLAAAGM